MGSGVSLVLVTGAARRLGADLARRFAADGHRVALHAHGSLEDARRICAEIAAKGGEAALFPGDFSKPGGAAAMFDALVAAMGVPDIVVNNASVFAYDSPGAADEAMLRASLEVHTLAPLAIIERAAKLKPTAQKLAVFNILDQRLMNMNPDFHSYTIGKAALRAAGEAWRAAGRADVRVFGIMPGLLLPSGAQSRERYEADTLKSPLRHGVSTRDIYEAIAFFAGNANLPGQDFAVDCGESLTARGRDVAFE